MYVWKHALFAQAEILGFLYSFGDEGCGGSLYNPAPKLNVALPSTPKPPIRPIVSPTVMKLTIDDYESTSIQIMYIVRCTRTCLVFSNKKLSN